MIFIATPPCDPRGGAPTKAVIVGDTKKYEAIKRTVARKAVNWRFLSYTAARRKTRLTLRGATTHSTAALASFPATATPNAIA